MGEARRIVIAGAGALGTVIALRLARAGHRATVIDSVSGGHASSIAAGMLAPAFERLFDEISWNRLEFLTAARDMWPALGVPLIRDGALAVGAREVVEGWAATLTEAGAAAEVLTPAWTAVRAPRLPPGSWSVFSPEDWRLEAGAALKDLRRDAAAQGADFVAGEVVDFTSARVLLASGRSLDADHLVIATGASASLAGVAPQLAALRPIKGHILRMAAVWPAGPVVRAPGLYVCPGGDALIVGATMEPGESSRGVDQGIAADLARRAAALAPELAGVAWQADAGVRGSTSDGLPVVGEVGGSGVILAVGARRNGWLLAPLIADEVIRAVEGGRPGAFTSLFAPDRFA